MVFLVFLYNSVIYCAAAIFFGTKVEEEEKGPSTVKSVKRHFKLNLFTILCYLLCFLML